jgi:biopolymer transport protein TolQ
MGRERLPQASSKPIKARSLRDSFALGASAACFSLDNLPLTLSDAYFAARNPGFFGIRQKPKFRPICGADPAPMPFPPPVRRAVPAYKRFPAPMNPADVAAAAATPETSIFEMFWSAHIVVKAVMLGLFLASLWCWTIIFDKTRLFHKFKNEMENFEQIFWSGQSLEELYTSLSSQSNNTGAAALFVAAMREWKRSFQQAAGSFRGLHARIDKVLDVSIAREVERLESNLLVLATIASAGPFIGLFGTVFGIMNSFQSIAASKNTSLAVVAPGIAEALLATAIGLFAAIPALIAYNKLQGDVAKAQARLESFADEFSSILSRQIDHHLSVEKVS